MRGRRFAALALCAPWGPALAAAVFSVLVMGLGGESVAGLRPAVEWLAASGIGLAVVALGMVGGLVGVGLAPAEERAVIGVHLLALLPSVIVGVGAASVLASLPSDFAWAGEWTPPARQARAAAAWCMMTGFLGLATLRVWRRHARQAAMGEPLTHEPDDRRGFLVAAGLSAVVLLGLLVG